MKPINKQTVKSASKFITIGLLIGLLIGAFIAYGQSPSSTFTISSGVYPGAPSYTVWTEGSEVFAKDANGLLAYSGTNASQIIQTCIDALPIYGGKIFIKAGEYLFDSTIAINKDNVHIQGEGIGWHSSGAEGTGISKLKATSSYGNMFLIDSLGRPSNLVGISFSQLTLFGPAVVPVDGFSGIYITGYDGAQFFQVNIQNFPIGLCTGSGESAVISNCFLAWNGKEYVSLGNSYNILMNNVLSDTGYGADNINVHLKGATLKTKIISNGIANGYQGIKIEGTSIDNIITDNNFGFFTTTAINDIVGGNLIHHNKGYITENSGTATIATTTVTFDHGLAETPTGVWASFNSTAITGWTWTATATNITATVTPTGAYTIYWSAQYQP